MTRRKVLITGASGLIGGRTINHLGDKCGLSTIVIRLGAVLKEDRPLVRRHYPGYPSQADCLQLIDKCLSAPDTLKYDIFNAISENKYRWRSTNRTKAVLGWQPTGRAEDFPLATTKPAGFEDR